MAKCHTRLSHPTKFVGSVFNQRQASHIYQSIIFCPFVGFSVFGAGFELHSNERRSLTLRMRWYTRAHHLQHLLWLLGQRVIQQHEYVSTSSTPFARKLPLNTIILLLWTIFQNNHKSFGWILIHLTTIWTVCSIFWYCVSCAARGLCCLIVFCCTYFVVVVVVRMSLGISPVMLLVNVVFLTCLRCAMYRCNSFALIHL